MTLPRDAMALRVKHAGTFGPHGAAHRIGFKEGDILTEFDSRNGLIHETV